MDQFTILWEHISGKPRNYMRLVIKQWIEDDRLSRGGSFEILDIIEGEAEFLQEMLLKRVTPWKGNIPV